MIHIRAAPVLVRLVRSTAVEQEYGSLPLAYASSCGTHSQQQQQHSLLSQASWGRLEMKPRRHKGQQQNNNNNNIGLGPRVQNSFAVEIATQRKPSARLDRNWSRFLYVLGALDFWNT